MELATIPATQRDDTLARALSHLASLQKADGCWEGEVVWNPMLLAQYVIVHRLTGQPAFDEATRMRMIRHFAVTRTPEGGWGMHPESGPYLFFTTISYVALRLLGVAADDPLAARARAWIRGVEGGVLAVPSWGKVWLSLVGLHEWEGVNPIPPEIFLLPSAAPIHPDRYYCHTRYIYLAISYLYGRRFSGSIGPITLDLRRELYDQSYADIDFSAHRHHLAQTDLYVRPGPELRLAWDALVQVERFIPPALRQKALERGLSRIRYELRQTRYQCISPVNGLLNVLALFAHDPHDPEIQKAFEAVSAWRWDDEREGIRFCGARSNAWDTAFALRAALEAPAHARPVAAIRRAYAWLAATQMTDDLEGREPEARASILGGWCFSDGQHRWPVSDCTAEALAAVLRAHEIPNLIAEKDRIPEHRIRQAVQFILDRQNDDGGFGSYEKRRGGAFLEALNPSEMYGSCMTERSYVECTASAVGLLSHLRTVHPDMDRARVDEAIARGVALIRREQKADGSWAGFWGINRTYAIFHCVEALRAAGAPADDSAIWRAARWLERHQKSDGGWGEHYAGCLDNRYVEHPESQVIMTAWAVLALLHAGGAGSRAVERGIAFLRRRQEPDGGFPEQAVSGVFFGTAMLHYRLYKDYFPAWALARHAAENAGVRES
ncbi:MAG: 2,3-oxidosqualene cyclase [Minicystis sp.]